MNSRFPEGLDDGADLVLRHHVPVQLTGRIGKILVQFFRPPRCLGFAVAPVDMLTRFDAGPVLGDLRADAVDIRVDVYAIGHRLLVGVLHHEVLLEESEGLR